MHTICLAQKKKVIFLKKGVVFSNCDFYKNKQMTAKTYIGQELKKTKTKKH